MTQASVKGMRDYYPDELAIRNWLFDRFRSAAIRYGFEEYDPCIVEHEELFIRKEGDEITAQLYSFTDKGNRRIALRPEITPSLARMVLAKQGSLALPLRWFTIGQCFRYEKMQKGRKREHYQWNMDIIGEESLVAELELLSAAVDMLRGVGLSEKDIVIRFGNRKLLSRFLQLSGVPAERFGEVSVILDKLAKIGASSVAALLDEIGIEREVVSRTIEYAHATNMDEITRLIGELPAAAGEIEQFTRLAEAYGIGGFLEFTPSLVRGLSYYTGTVFEGFERSGGGRSIFGGGRYDRLLETYGGTSAPMAGLGFGDVVILDLLASRGLLPAGGNDYGVLVVAFSESEIPGAVAAARQIRGAQIPTEIDVSFRRLKKTFARADRLGFRYVVVVAPDELRSGELSVKDMRTGTEVRVATGEVVRAVSAGG